MNNKEKITILERALWYCERCEFCIHKTFITGYPDCKVGWCEHGNKFQLDYEKLVKEIDG